LEKGRKGDGGCGEGKRREWRLWRREGKGMEVMLKEMKGNGGCVEGKERGWRVR
jgi:hypothetical protein